MATGLLQWPQGSGGPRGLKYRPDSRAAHNAGQWADRIVARRFPDDLPADAPPFDVVAFTDVLEHFENPWSALRAAATLLALGGAVVASIPNIWFWPVGGR